jgi:hypothetical protein
MSAVMGKDGYFKIGTSAVGYIDNWSASISVGTTEVPQLGKDYKNREYTVRDVTGSFSGTLDLTDAGQTSIYSTMLKGGTLAKADLHLGLNSTNELTGSACITSFDISVPAEDKVTFSCSFEADGEFEMKAPVAG